MNSQKMESIANIYHTLKECHRQALSLLGEKKFIEQVNDLSPRFQEVMSANNCSELEALPVLIRRVQANPALHQGMEIHRLCAVACELAEPSVTKGNAA